MLDRDWDRMLTFYQFPKAHWVHLRATNPIESPFAALRLRTDAAKRFKKARNATAVLWKMLLVAQQRFRRLTALELMTEAHDGVQYVNGVRVQERPWEVAAGCRCSRVRNSLNHRRREGENRSLSCSKGGKDKRIRRNVAIRDPPCG